MVELTVHVVSDSLGDTAAKVADAVTSQFPKASVRVDRKANVRSLDDITSYVRSHQLGSKPVVVLHTLVDNALRRDFKRWALSNGVYEVDLIGPAIDAMASITGLEPLEVAGLVHKTGEQPL